MNDITLPNQYDHIKLKISNAFIEINGPENHYKGNGAFTFNILLGEQKGQAGNYPILVSFKHHQRHPVNQIRSGQQSDHYTDFLGCESILLNCFAVSLPYLESNLNGKPFFSALSFDIVFAP